MPLGNYQGQVNLNGNVPVNLTVSTTSEAWWTRLFAGIGIFAAVLLLLSLAWCGGGKDWENWRPFRGLPADKNSRSSTIEAPRTVVEKTIVIREKARAAAPQAAATPTPAPPPAPGCPTYDQRARIRCDTARLMASRQSP